MTKGAAGHWEGNPYRRPNSPFWHIVFEDASGVVRRKSTKTKDLRVARDFLSAQLREVEQTKAGVVDRYAESRRVPLDDLVVAFKQHLEAQGSARVYVVDTTRQIRAFVAFAKIATLPDIALPDVERFVDDVRRRRSVKTRDHHAGALRTFGRWLVRTGRWGADPFHGLATCTANRDKHRIFKRVGLLFEEAERLVDAALLRHEAERTHGGMAMHAENADAARDRQVLYWFALTCAFRANECRSVRWEDLTLDGPKLAVRLAGQFTKNGNDANVPMQGFVADALKQMRVRRSESRVRRGLGPVLETDLVFHVPCKIAQLVRKDAAYAGLTPQRGPTSRRIDFHALRKSCARILIEMGVHPKLIQQTLRHADIRLTMNLYGEWDETDLFRELPGRFPTPKMFTKNDGGPPAGTAPNAAATA